LPVPDDIRLAVLIPAAGASTRLGRPKQLLEIDGEALVRRTARLALSLQPNPLIVVTGAESDRVKRTLADLPLTTVYNPVWRDGLGGSIAAGARAIDTRPDAVMVLLCDQWRVDAGDVERLCAEWLQHTAHIVASRWDDRHGPPVLFPGALLPALGELQGDAGARHLLEADPERCRFVEVQNAAYDLDTPEDLGFVSDQFGG
jgi:CTP:molybdopterin cytidylyltransferase MocA